MKRFKKLLIKYKLVTVSLLSIFVTSLVFLAIMKNSSDYIFYDMSSNAETGEEIQQTSDAPSVNGEIPTINKVTPGDVGGGLTCVVRRKVYEIGDSIPAQLMPYYMPDPANIRCVCKSSSRGAIPAVHCKRNNYRNF